METEGKAVKRLFSLVVAVVVALMGSPDVQAQAVTGASVSAGAYASTDDLTKQIIRKEAELLRLTTFYRIHNPRETILHKWFVATTSTAAYSVANAGNIVTFSNAFRYHRRPQDFSTGRAEAGPFLIFLGELLFVGRTLGETFLDLTHAGYAHHLGFDRKTYERKGTQLEQEIHSLLVQAQQQASDPVAKQEVVVLSDIADNASDEFVANCSRTARLRAFRCGLNFMDNYTSGTGAFWGGLLIYLAAAHKHPETAGTGGIGFIVSGTGFMTGQAVAYAASKIAEKRTRAQLLARRPGLKPDAGKKLDDDLRALASMSGSQHQKACELMSTCLARHRALHETENRRMYHKFLHDETINFCEGGANIAAGSILAQAGFKFRPGNNILDALHNGDTFLEKFGWAALVFTPTASGGMVDTPGEAIYGSLRSWRDNQLGIGPKSVLDERLAALDQIDGMVK